MSKISAKNNSKSFFSRLGNAIKENLFATTVLGILWLIGGGFFLGVGIFTNNMPDKPSDIKIMTSQYKTLQQESINDYNLLLTNSQNHPDQLININELGESYKINNIEEYYGKHNTDGRISCDCHSSTEYVTRLNNLLTTTNNKLITNLKKVNNAISRSVKVDYDSLKITDNSIIDAKLQSITDKYVKDYKNDMRWLKFTAFWPFWVITCFIFLLWSMFVIDDFKR